MKDSDLQQLFENMDRRPPDAAAKQRTLGLALQAFAESRAQGLTEDMAPVQKKISLGQYLRHCLRLTGEDSISRRSSKMTAYEQKWLYSGIAGACVLVLAVSLMIHQPRRAVVEPYHPDLLVLPGKSDDAHRPAHSEPRQRAEHEVALADSHESSVEADAASVMDEYASRQAAAEQAFVAAELQNNIADLSTVAKKQSSAMTDRARRMPEAVNGVSARAVSPLEATRIAEQPAANDSYQDTGRDRFQVLDSNPVQRVAEAPVSTFSIDVDTASYSFVRRQLNSGHLPQKDAVRLEEMVNYFDYAYPAPGNRLQPFEPTVLVSDSPWKAGNKLVQIGIRGYDLTASSKPKTNLVLLLDVSGSMNSPDKLPLVKQSVRLLLSQLQPEDTIGIVVYAGAAGTVLEPTPVKDGQKISAALNRLQAGGSTAGAEGIQLAYRLAEHNFEAGAVNRIILATDGDFNVGITNREELKGFVERQRDKGIFLSVLGFGQGNYHDHMMQVLAQNGNGIAAYIDTLSEARKVLVDEATSTLFTIARDVKIQVEFNPATVSEYRLLGYETRKLKREDFNNDAVDAGDIGAGHTVTAIYEITPLGSESGLIDDSRYTPNRQQAEARNSEYGFLKIRYKLPSASDSQLLTRVIPAANGDVSAVLSRESAFATAVAGFAQLLRGGQYTGSWSYDDALELAQRNKGEDAYGYRTELVQLIRQAKLADSL